MHRAETSFLFCALFPVESDQLTSILYDSTLRMDRIARLLAWSACDLLEPEPQRAQQQKLKANSVDDVR
jgi:hypothetical protein